VVTLDAWDWIGGTLAVGVGATN